MKTIEIYDPAMCCSTGVCGTDVSPALIQTAQDIEWLRQRGVGVERFNLAQDPMAFAAQPQVAAALKEDGEACLPLTLVDGRIVMRSFYPTRDQMATLAGFNGDSSCCDSPEADHGSCCGGGSEGCCE